MDAIYLEAVVIMQKARSKLEKLIIKNNGKSFENERACISIDNLLIDG